MQSLSSVYCAIPRIFRITYEENKDEIVLNSQLVTFQCMQLLCFKDKKLSLNTLMLLALKQNSRRDFFFLEVNINVHTYTHMWDSQNIRTD